MAKKVNQTRQASRTKIGNGAQVNGVIGPVHNQGNMIFNPPTAIAEPQPYKVTDAKPTPITTGIVTLTSWLVGLTGLIAALKGLYEVSLPFQAMMREGSLLSAGRAEPPSVWSVLLAAGALLAAFGLLLPNWFGFLYKENYKLSKHLSNKAWAGQRDGSGKLRLYRVRLDGTCIHCGGHLRFYDRPADREPVFNPEGQITKYRVTRREPVSECDRNYQHRAPFEITDTHRL